MLIDVICLLVLVACCLSGYRKGLLMSLCSLLVLVLCCLGASLAQETLTPKAVDYLEPKLAERVEVQLQTELEGQTQQAVEQVEDTGLTIGGQRVTLGDLVDLLGRFGLDVEQSVTEGTSEAMEPALHAAAQAVARAVVEPIAGLLIYFAAFLILYLVLHSVVLAVNVVDRLPVLHTLNRAGGILFGLAEGVLLLTVLLVVLARSGFLPEEALEGLLGRLLRQAAGRFFVS